MNRRQLFALLVAVGLLLATGPAALAQTITPDVRVAGTGIVNGEVTIIRATVIGRGWVVIHADANGQPGAIIGYAPLVPGDNHNVKVKVNPALATPLLHAMLHMDAGTIFALEESGPDVPIKVNGNIVKAKFSATPVVEE